MPLPGRHCIEAVTKTLPPRIDIGEASPEILELTNEEIAEEFLALLEASGASPETIKAYRSAIYDFLEYLGDKPLKEVRLTDIVRWRSLHLKKGFRKSKTKDKNQQRVTLHYYNLFIRRFLRWLGFRTHVPNIRKPPRRIEVLTENEIAALYKAVRDPMDKIILDLLLDTGLRSKELLGLKVRDIDFENKIITVRNAKYGKERRVLATPETLEELRIWIMLRNLGEDDRLIPLTYSGLYKRIKKLARMAGIDASKVRPHIFRHTFATRALRRGMSIASLQKLLGHTDIRTTQVYTHLTIEDVKREYMQTMAVVKKCPVCQRDVPMDAQYCPYCGAPLKTGHGKYSLGTV